MYSSIQYNFTITQFSKVYSLYRVKVTFLILQCETMQLKRCTPVATSLSFYWLYKSLTEGFSPELVRMWCKTNMCENEIKKTSGLWFTVACDTRWVTQRSNDNELLNLDRGVFFFFFYISASQSDPSAWVLSCGNQTKYINTKKAVEMFREMLYCHINSFIPVVSSGAPCTSPIQL